MKKIKERTKRLQEFRKPFEQELERRRIQNMKLVYPEQRKS